MLWWMDVVVYSAEGKPLSKKALKKQQKDAEKAKRRADTAAKLVRLYGYHTTLSSRHQLS